MDTSRGARKLLVCLYFLPLFLIGSVTLSAQGIQTGVSSDTQSTTQIREILAFSYPDDRDVKLDLKGTVRMPDTEGEAEIERDDNRTEVKIKLDDMKPAVLFGGDFNTYVAWAVTPEGAFYNLGEIILDGDEGKIELSTQLSAFGLFVTAEPHFMVKTPSRFVVAEPDRTDDNDARNARVVQLRLGEGQRDYDFSRDTLKDAPEVREDVDAGLAQARTAVRLAERAGAATFAAAELAAARQALERAEESILTSKRREDHADASREAVRLAARAHELAQERLFQAEIEEERQKRSQEFSRLASAIAAANDAAERAKLEAEQQQLQARMEQEAREQAMSRLDHLQREAEQAREEAGEARAEAEQARQMVQQQDEIRAAEQRGRIQGMTEAGSVAQGADRRAIEENLARAEATLREAEETRREIDAKVAQLQSQAQTNEQLMQEAERARQEVELAREELTRIRQEADQAKDEASRLRAEQSQTRERLREALGQVVEVRETVKGLIVNLPDILFEFDKADLKPQAREVLSKVAGIIQGTPGLILNIHGHTDAVGTDEYNHQLSQTRAQSVRDFLVQSGVNPDIVVEIRGLGESQPLASNDTPEGREQNRRVEILVNPQDEVTRETQPAE